MSKVWKFLALVLGLLGAAFVMGLLFGANAAYATPSLQTAMISRYPGLRDTPLQDCSTCHMPVKADFLNSYGLALRDAQMKFEEIEELDSDADGVSNIDEINDESLPGTQATSPEYYIFHVNFSDKDKELGKVHFNHEMHVIKESFLSQGRCKNCHGKNLFPKEFNDGVSMREMAHQICWRCHETSGSKVAPTDCTGCHTGIKEIMDDVKKLLQ
ncbi:MAG: cytochrome c3 family protein [Pirellulaceae bacterium]